MFQKFIQIRRLGKFRNYNANGDCTFKRFNLIYAENGMGKTTLTSILHSIKENNPNILFQRKNVNEVDPPIVQIRAYDTNYNFDGNVWSSNFNDIEIFDNVFINQNVFSGEFVQLENKRNLYHLVVGAQGVELANQVSQLDSEIRRITQLIHTYSDQIQASIVGNLEISAFVSLENIDNIEERIQEKEIELEVAKNADAIIRQSEFSEINFPSIDKATIETVFNSSIDTISKNAEIKVKEHIANHLNENGEDWIENGLSFPQSQNCPFCNQNIESNELVKLYKDYFSEEYKSFKNKLENEISTLKSAFSTNITNQILPTYERNNSLKIFWERFFDINLPALNIENILESIDILLTRMNHLFSIKESDPLKAIPITDDFQDSYVSFKETISEIESYNKSINTLNDLIIAKKEESRNIIRITVENELNRLKNVRVRYTPDVFEYCNNYSTATQQKEIFETQKAETKERLDNETQDIFTRYQTAINLYLERFNVNFRIANAKKNYSGGKPSIKYFITLETHDFDPSNPSQNSICFQSALSEGDKSSLAFAFFLARLNLETNLENKIIVFDDPINSLGDHRRRCTVQEIIRIAPLCLQSIVLSHDAYFLRELYEGIQRIIPQYKLFKIQRVENGVNLINDWNVERETSGRYFESYNILTDYLAGIQTDNLRMVAMCIRPLLEGNLRLRFPTQFPQNEWLGQFIGRIRDANEGDELFLLNGIYEEIDEINDYSQNFHHDQNPDADTMNVNDTELQGFVRRTLRILPGILNTG